MDWKRTAKAELRDLPVMREAIKNIPERVRMLESQKTALKSSTTDSTPVQGGGNRYEDRLLDLIVEQERLKHTLKAHRLRIALVEKGLAALTDQERTILTTFALHRSSEAVDLLAEQLYLERSRIYQLWDDALRRYTIAEFGIVDF